MSDGYYKVDEGFRYQMMRSWQEELLANDKMTKDEFVIELRKMILNFEMCDVYEDGEMRQAREYGEWREERDADAYAEAVYLAAKEANL